MVSCSKAAGLVIDPGVLRRRRRVVFVPPKNSLCQPHRPLDRPVRGDHHPDPSSRDLHLI